MERAEYQTAGDLDKLFINYCKELLKERGWSRPDLARKIRIDPSNIYRHFEPATRDFRHWDTKFILKVARAFDMTPE